MNRRLVFLPQVSANDESAVLVEWSKRAGEEVRSGQILCVIESTKSVIELESEFDGFVYPLVEEGETVQVGTPIAVVSNQAGEGPAPLQAWVQSQQARQSPPERAAEPQRRWTKKAELLARRQGLDIEALWREHEGKRLSEADVLRYVQEGGEPESDVIDLVDDRYRRNRAVRVLVIGGGDGAVQVLDAIAHDPKLRPVAILDDNPTLHGKSIMGCPILGGLEMAEALWREERFDAAVISISSNLPLRARLYESLNEKGIRFASVIAPHVAIHANVSMGAGNLIMSHARLGACTVLGDNNFLSAYVNLEHHNRLGSHCTFGPMVTTSGRVEIGDRVLFGAGIFIEPHISIGDDCVISSGSILTASVPPRHIVKTRLLQALKPRKRD